MRQFLSTAFLILALALAGVGDAAAASKAKKPPDQDWPHEGVFGTLDKAALQRGFEVYKQVCSSCHGMKYVAYRNLTQIGFTPTEVEAIAAQYEVQDGPDDTGEMFMRPARPSDQFVSPYRNEAEARYINGGAYPKDLSLIVKARKGGEDYIYALLTGYSEPPEDVDIGFMFWNEYFKGNLIAMGDPLTPWEGAIDFADGTEATVEQMARDVSQFLVWASEPYHDERKQRGTMVILFLVVFAGVMYGIKQRVWSDLKK